MITVRKSAERGKTHIDWLESWHSFSFNTYMDPRHVHFGPLFEGPFMTEGECLTVLKAKYPQLAKTAPDQTGEFMYCQRLTGPV